MKRYLSLIVWLWCSLLSAADITITAPAKPIQPGRMVRLIVAGVTDAELFGSLASVVPPAGVDPETIDLFPGRTWQNQPYIDFTAQIPGKYFISIEVNGWSRTLEGAVKLAESANVPSNLLLSLKTAADPIFAAYPPNSGTCAVEVAGSVPPPPPPPPNIGLASQLIILRDQTAATTKSVAILLDLQEKYQRGTKPEMFLLDKQETSSLARSYVNLKPVSAAFPYYFLVEQGGRVLAHGELADTTEKNFAIIAKFQEPK